MTWRLVDSERARETSGEKESQVLLKAQIAVNHHEEVAECKKARAEEMERKLAWK